MNPKKYRWSRVYESAEEELQDFMHSRNITAKRYEIESYSTYDVAPQAEMVHLWGVEGTSKATVGDMIYSLQPGDVLDLPPHTPATITTTLSNFAWYQS